jgi:hypothetical protein
MNPSIIFEPAIAILSQDAPAGTVVTKLRISDGSSLSGLSAGIVMAMTRPDLRVSYHTTDLLKVDGESNVVMGRGLTRADWDFKCEVSGWDDSGGFIVGWIDVRIGDPRLGVRVEELEADRCEIKLGLDRLASDTKKEIERIDANIAGDRSRLDRLVPVRRKQGRPPEKRDAIVEELKNEILAGETSYEEVMQEKSARLERRFGTQYRTVRGVRSMLREWEHDRSVEPL